MKRLLCTLLLVASGLFADTARTTGAPSSPAVVTTQTVDITSMYFANNSASAVTCTLTDGSGTNFWPAVSLAANTVYVLGLERNTPFLEARLGFSWSCSTTSVVIIEIRYKVR